MVELISVGVQHSSQHVTNYKVVSVYCALQAEAVGEKAMSLLPASTAVRLKWLALLTQRLVPEARPLRKLRNLSSSHDIRGSLPGIAPRVPLFLSQSTSA